MVDAFLGNKYKLATSENFDEFMKALGIGFITRKLGATIFPVLCLQKEEDYYILTSESTFKNTSSKFKPGEEFDDITADGRKVKSVITINGNVLIEVQKDESGRVIRFERTFTAEEVKTVCKINNLVCIRIYKIVE